LPVWFATCGRRRPSDLPRDERDARARSGRTKIEPNRPAIVDQPLTVDEAIRIVTSWYARPNVHRIDPGADHWARLETVARDAKAFGNALMDVHLAALTLEHGATLATTDRGFSRFHGLRTIDPSRTDLPGPAG
jgi:predicted nucleic acid-binding protein